MNGKHAGSPSSAKNCVKLYLQEPENVQNWSSSECNIKSNHILLGETNINLLFLCYNKTHYQQDTILRYDTNHALFIILNRQKIVSIKLGHILLKYIPHIEYYVKHLIDLIDS